MLVVQQQNCKNICVRCNKFQDIFLAPCSMSKQPCVHDSSLFMRNVEKVRPEEMQLFTYINAKLMFFSKKVGQNFGDMNAALSQKRCQQTMETIKNGLALATLSPDLFAFSQNNNQPGMSAKLAGEVVHLFKCEKNQSQEEM